MESLLIVTFETNERLETDRAIISNGDAKSLDNFLKELENKHKDKFGQTPAIKFITILKF